MMEALGLELRDASAAAIAVDGAGAVLARAVGAATGDVPTAALGAVDTVVRAAASGPLGVAAHYPGQSPPADILALLKPRYAGPFLKPGGVTSSGTAAAVGEARVGASRGVCDSVCFAALDHVYCGIIRDGALVVGAGQRVASIAWFALNPVEREDYRRIGCLEAEVAAAEVIRRLIWRIKTGDKSRVADAVNGNMSGITEERVLEAARHGDGVSIAVMRDAAKYLGMAAANLVTVMDPEMLVIGGIMATTGDLLLEPVRSELARRLPRHTMEALALSPAVLGDDAAAIGAARLAMAVLE